jgi:hypothetical protein
MQKKNNITENDLLTILGHADPEIHRCIIAHADLQNQHCIKMLISSQRSCRFPIPSFRFQETTLQKMVY